jgi:hypothetical protein
MARRHRAKRRHDDMRLITGRAKPLVAALAWFFASIPARAAQAVPDWVARLAVGQWYEIPDTAPAAKIGNPFPDQGGRPSGRFAYSGSTLRKAGSWLFLFGGGHADYSGNDIHAIKLNAAKPKWELLSPATPFSRIPWKSSERGDSHYADGTPASRHTYWQPQFIDSLDRMFLFLAMVVWGNSSGSFGNVDAFRFSDRRWDAKDAWPAPPVFKPQATGPWTVKHPKTDDVYLGIGARVLKWSSATGQWTFIIANDTWAHDRGIAALDPVRKRILVLGEWNKPGVNMPRTVPLTPGDKEFVALTGPYAEAFSSWDAVRFAGFVFDPDLDRYVLFPDDGYTYTIHPQTWRVERLAVRGDVPPPHSREGVANGIGIYGRFQYVPELKGIVYMPAWKRNLYFLKTGNEP